MLQQKAVSMSHAFRARLKQNDTLLGTMVTLPTPITAEILADIGFDWLFLDAEHGPLETAELLAILQVVGKRIPCLVRVPQAAEVPIKKALDLGAAGVIAPQTNTATAVENVVRWARYSPEGARGVGIGRAHGYGMNFADYVERANNEVTVVIQAEHIDAVNNIEQIVKVEGIDAVLLGPYDLSASMGKMGEVTNPEVLQAIEHVTRCCREAGIPLGYFGVNADAVKPYIAQGYSLIVAGVDTILLGSTASRMLDKLRN